VSTEEEISRLDVAAMLPTGLADEGPYRRALFGEGAVAAAIVLGGLGVIPRSLTFLAEVVRSGGTTYAAALPEPLPVAAQSDLMRTWLTAAAEAVSTPDGDEVVARWLDSVATILAARLVATGGGPPPLLG
jgi:hypothetical protein